MTSAARSGRGPTIRDVAERAGVSKSLVSLVLRDAEHVSEARRQKVERAIIELGYRPNRSARSLSTARTDAIGVLLNDLRNPWFIDLLAGLTTSLHEAGLGSIIADSHTDARAGKHSVDTLVAHGVDGLVVVGTTTESDSIVAASSLLPVVIAGTLEPELARGDVVVNDDYAGATMATRHLIDLGHRRIAHLQGPGRIGELRMQGYRDTMSAAGLSGLVTVTFGGMNEDTGYPAARELLSAAPPPTAVVAFNDMTAIATLSAADDLGLAVPGDVSVTGYDDTSLARMRHLSLTSVDNGNFAVGLQAGRFLIERLADPNLSPRRHTVTTELHVRTSSTEPKP